MARQTEVVVDTEAVAVGATGRVAEVVDLLGLPSLQIWIWVSEATRKKN